MTKKIIALLLALVMIVGVLPLTALADQGADDPQGQGVVEEQKGPEENKDPENQNGSEENKDPENQKDPEDNKDTENQKDSEDNKDTENQEITNKFKSVSATVKATLGGIMPTPYAGNSTVVLHPSTGTTPTGFKVSVGSTINGYKVTKLNSSNYEITIDLGTYNVSLMSFRIPFPEEVWTGVKMQYNPQTYVIAGTSGDPQKTPGANALLGNGKNTFYYYNLGPDSSGGSDSYLWNFTLQFDANGGSGAPAPLTYGTNDKYAKSYSFTIPSTQPTREGYTFKGWSKTPTGAASYQSGGTCLVSQTASGYNGGSVTVTLYAVWEKDAPTPPSKPTPGQVAGLLKEAVKIDCVNTEIDPEHADKTYDLISGTYSIGNVQGNATDGYTSVVTVLKKYAGQYVSKYDSEIGVDHSLDPADQTDQTITLEYKDGKWAVQAGSAPVTFTVKCATPPTEEPVDWTKLTISKKADKTTVKPGDTIIYTITVTNNTGKTLTNITVSDVLDSNLTFVSAEPVYYNSATGQWTIFSLTNGNSATLTITATVKSGVADGTQITNTAKITTVNAGGDALEEVNKSSSVEATVAIPAVEGIEKEVVTSAPNDVTIPEGTTVTYPTSNSVTVDNGTTSVTLLYKVTVTGDAGASYSVSDEGATCITNNATGTIPEGGEVVLYFTKTFTNLSTGDKTASNTASLVGTNYTDSVNVTITVKPAKPTDDELKTLLAGAVGVACTNESVEHASKTYNLLSGSYTIGDVTSVGDGTFTCTITVDAEKYVEAYNKDVAPGHDLDDESPKTIELVYRDKVWVKVSGVAELSDDEVIPPDITFGVLCTTYKLTYDANGGTGAPTDTKAYSHGAKVTLATTPVPTHAMYADGDPVVFIGWTASKTSTIYTKTDTAPATITSVTFDDSNITVYAAWGVDHNGDNIADVLQRVTLTYDANGGTGAPSSQSGLPGSFPISATRPTRTQ